MEFTDVAINLSLVFLGLVIAIYAIGLPVLNTLLRSNRIRLQRRVDEVQNEIRKISQEGSGRQLLNNVNKELEHLKKEEKDIISTEANLRLKNAVYYPSISFFMTILLIIYNNSIITVYKSSFNSNILFGVSVEYYLYGFIFLIFLYGIRRLIKTLTAIEYVSINIPLPSFEVTFPNELKSITINSGNLTTINIEVYNEGYELAEIVNVYLTFPPNLIIEETDDYSVYQESETSTEYPNHWRVSYSTDIIHMGCVETIPINMMAQPIPGRYRIPIYVLERKIGETEHNLEIIVT
jgi:uncharacterized membrane protein (DUF106 family)